MVPLPQVMTFLTGPDWQCYMCVLNIPIPHDSKCQGEGWDRVALNTAKSVLGSSLLSYLDFVQTISILRPTVLHPNTFPPGEVQWTEAVREGCMRSLPTSYKATLEVSWVATVLFKEAERVTDFRLLFLTAMLFASVRLSKVSLWKARKADARQLPPLGVNLHSSSALQHGFLAKEIMGVSPSRSPALGMSQNGPGMLPSIFECRHFILDGKMVYLFGHALWCTIQPQEQGISPGS